MPKKSPHGQLSFNCCNHELLIDINENEFKLFTELNSDFITKPIIDNKIIIKKTFFKKPVVDIIRFQLLFNNSKWIFNTPDGNTLNKFEGKTFDKALQISEHNIFLILESPHKHEYDPEMNPLGPAMKSTGNYIYHYFYSKILPDLFQKGLILDIKKTYNFCLINPVPYQTSLFYITQKKINPELRDKIWRQLYKYTERDFINKIKIFSPIIIINCCTGKVKESVQITINNNINSKVQIHSTSHPSRWLFMKKLI